LSLAFWEAQRLVVFEDRILTKMFGSDEEQVTADGQNCITASFVMWTGLVIKWVGLVARMEEKKNSYVLLVRKREGKRPFGRPRYRWRCYEVDLKNKTE